MANIEEIVNDHGWQPSSGKPIITSVKAIVKALENGLLYVAPADNKSAPILEQTEWQVPYQLINVVRAEREGVPGLAATFEYKAGKTPEGLDEKFPAGLDAARIEYTTWHNPAYGLTLLTSVQAHQLVKGGWLDVQLSLPTYGNSERAMIMEVSSLSESLKFGKDGTLEKQVPRLFLASPELKGVYKFVTNGAQVDPLRTAVALINGFPKQMPLRIEQLIQYQSPTSIQR